MRNLKIIFESDEEIFGYFKKAKEWISYKGKLVIRNRKTKPIELSIKMDYVSIGLDMVMPERKIFASNRVTEVYVKLSYWLLSYGVTFKN